jgi:hypothetical protein
MRFGKLAAKMWAGRCGVVNYFLPVQIYGCLGFSAGLRAWKGHGGELPAGI